MPAQTDMHERVRTEIKSGSRFGKFLIGSFRAFDQDASLTIKFKDGGKVEVRWLDVVMQLGWGQGTFEEHILAATLWQRLMQGQLHYRAVEIARPPFADRAIVANRRILRAAVRRYRDTTLAMVKADFWGGNQDEDGFVELAHPLDNGGFSVCFHRDGRPGKKYLPPRQFRLTHYPLEAGSCRVDQVLSHLGITGGLVRWPYGYNLLIFLEVAVRPRTSASDPGPGPN